MSEVTEIGRVGGWRYVVVRSGYEFEVLRQDLRFDQVEEALVVKGARDSLVLDQSVR